MKNIKAFEKELDYKVRKSVKRFNKEVTFADMYRDLLHKIDYEACETLEDFADELTRVYEDNFIEMSCDDMFYRHFDGNEIREFASKFADVYAEYFYNKYN